MEFRNKYRISSNKESGLGRYDIMLEPKEKGEDAFIIEFKVVHTRRGGNAGGCAEIGFGTDRKKEICICTV